MANSLDRSVETRALAKSLSCVAGVTVLLASLVLVLAVVQASAQDVLQATPAGAAARTAADSLRTVSMLSIVSPDASSRKLCFGFEDKADTIRLPDRNIFVGSERITIGNVLLDRGRYFLDCEKGIVVLGSPVPAGTEVEVQYRFLPFHVRPFQRLRVGETGSSETPQPVSRQTASLLPAAGMSTKSGLRLRGTKSFSLELGSNREASLKQSLEMNVTGEITKGLELNAVLTDRDLPIQPEGRTESVRELDEIRVEMRSDNMSASLGDCDFALEGASLLSVSRKLEGVKAAGRLGGTELAVAGSTLRGRWTSREFYGVDGKQGPYQLTTDAGATCVVIAGTERVWLDGARLRRGESADYWMDYGAGKLYFTNAHLVQEQSRIRVEYEYSYGDYQKNFYAARIGRSFGARGIKLDLTVVSESDDGSLASAGLSEEERNILTQLGDSPSLNTVDGARYVGPGKGDYEIVGTDSAGVSVFKYVEEGSGSYVVSFVSVGFGRGSYVASADTTGKTYYTYVGPNQADYVPSRRVVAPASRRVEDLRTSFTFGGAEFTGELALCQADLNTFSTVDDHNNFGKAALLSVKTNPARLQLGGRSLGSLGFSGHLRHIGQNFLTFGNLNRAFEHETWAVPDTATLGRGERRLELEASYAPRSNLTFTMAHGRLLSSSGVSARRWAYSSELSGRLSVTAKMERAVSQPASGNAAGSEQADALAAGATSSRTVISVGSMFSGLRVVPSLSYYGEVRELAGSPGVVVDEAGGGLTTAWKIPVSFRVEEKYRVERLGTRGASVRSFDALTHTVAAELARWRTLNVSCEYSLRDLHDYRGAGNRRTELGRLAVSQSPLSERLSYEVSHRVTSLHSEQSAKNIVYVGENQGHYDSTGTYRGRGDYEMAVVKLDASTVSSDAATSASLTLRPFRGSFGSPGAKGSAPNQGDAPGGEGTAAEESGSLAAWLETLSSSTLLRSSGVLAGSEGVFSLLSEPLYTEHGSALRANTLVREDLEISEPGRRASLRYTYEVSKNLNNLYQNVREKSGETRNSFRLRGELLRNLTLELAQVWKIRSREVEVYRGASASGDLKGSETALDVRFLPVRNLELGLYGSVSSLEDLDTAHSLRVYKASPSATYGAATSTRARLMCTISSYQGNTQVLSTANPVALLEPYRVEVAFSLDHRAGEHLTFSTSASTRKSTGSFVTDGRVEMRAHF